MIFVGDDWAEAHHDVYVCDEAGVKLASRRLPEGIEGMAKFHDLVASHAGDPGEVVIGIETDRGLWVNALVEAGCVVYAINPKAASRYRDRHSLSGAKSDPGDAKMLAELVRTDRHNHRQVAGDSALAEGIKIIARAHQSLVWERTRATNRLRSSLREYFPAALDTFSELADRDTLAVLSAAATPSEAAKLTPAKIRTVLRRAGRQRNIETRADTIAAGLRSDALRAPATVEVAHGATTRSSVSILAALNTQIDALAAELADRDTLAVLAAAATPSEAAKLTPGKIRTVLRRAGRQRNIDTRADAIAAGLRSDALRAPAAVEAAHGATTRSSVAILAELNTQIDALAAELADHFEQHPDSDIYLSLPGVGVVLGARALGEFGDDPNRYADAKSRKNYAGTSPITRASGTRSVVLARYVRNDRLADALDQWAFSSITSSPGARAFYDRRRAARDSHHKALRALGNRWVGIVHGCLDHRTHYDENTAWSHRIDTDLREIARAA